MSPSLPPLLPVDGIHDRLLAVFPEGTPNRNYCTREIAAKTVYVMLYMGAIAGSNRYLRPDQVTRMTDTQAALLDEAARVQWIKDSLSKTRSEIKGRWYAVNTREPIRDETLRDGLVRTGAVVVKPGVPTTSALPRYVLSASFAGLFHPARRGKALKNAIKAWQTSNLSASALARIQIVGRGAVASEAGLIVIFPSGETRKLAEGPSSVITKAVVEEFAPRFLETPGVIFLSESGNKVVERDDSLAKSIGLAIPADRFLPDVLLVDLGPKEPLLVFVEVVASDGAITQGRKQSFTNITAAAGFSAGQVAFVSAYMDRSRPAFRRTVPELAWQSFAWFASEPDHIVILREGKQGPATRLSELL